MLSKEQEREQRIQEAKAFVQKVKTTIHELCSKIGEIDQELLEFIVRDAKNIPSKSDTINSYPVITENIELACNVVQLYCIFDFTSDIIPQSVQNNGIICRVIEKNIFSEALSEVRASLLDTTSVSEISTSTLDTTMGTNSSVLHGSSDYCEL